MNLLTFSLAAATLLLLVPCSHPQDVVENSATPIVSIHRQTTGLEKQQIAPIVQAAFLSEEQKRFEEFRKSVYYATPFEPDLLAMPEGQLVLIRKLLNKNLELFREILREAIAKKNSFAPSVSLMWKYTGKLLGSFIKNRRAEMALNPRHEIKPEFFLMLASLTERVLDKSAEIKKEKGYSKNTVDSDELYRRVDAILKYIQLVVDNSPVSGYLNWDEIVLFKGDDPLNPNNGKDLIEEASDLTAQFRGMGYEKCIFVAKRIVNLLRMFSRGRIPDSEKDV